MSPSIDLLALASETQSLPLVLTRPYLFSENAVSSLLWILPGLCGIQNDLESPGSSMPDTGSAAKAVNRPELDPASTVLVEDKIVEVGCMVAASVICVCVGYICVWGHTFVTYTYQTYTWISHINTTYSHTTHTRHTYS